MRVQWLFSCLCSHLHRSPIFNNFLKLNDSHRQYAGNTWFHSFTLILTGNILEGSCFETADRCRGVIETAVTVELPAEVGEDLSINCWRLSYSYLKILISSVYWNAVSWSSVFYIVESVKRHWAKSFLSLKINNSENSSFCFFCLIFKTRFLYVYLCLSQNSFCKLCWLWTQKSICLSLLSGGMKVVYSKVILPNPELFYSYIVLEICFSFNQS